MLFIVVSINKNIFVMVFSTFFQLFMFRLTEM